MRWRFALFRVAVASSLALLSAGLVSALASKPVLHVVLAGFGSVAVFYAVVFVAYVSSLGGGRGCSSGFSVLQLALYASSLLVSWPRPALSLYSVGVLAGLAAVLCVLPSTLSGPGARIVVPLLLSYLGGAAASIVLLGKQLPLVELVIVLLNAPILASAYSINLYSLYQTYRLGGLLYSAVAVVGAHSLGVIAYASTGDQRLMGLAAAAYAALVVRGALASRPRSPAHKYFVRGQYLVALFSLGYAIALLQHYDVVKLAHILSMGLIASHIYIHAPLMLPPMMGLRHARRYWSIPYILLAASLAARLADAGLFAAVLFACSLASMIYVFTP